jgi:2-keto-4-pentenoate hydratase/2-oxohepta-3-ene-1,7-dioic acid hydratase in catechol pathway
MRVGASGAERPAVLDRQSRPRDLSGVFGDLSPEWLAQGGLDSLRGLDFDTLPLIPLGQRIGAPVSRVGKIVCVGLNYSDHAAETGQEVPKEPILFLKAGHTVQGPNDQIRIPRASMKSDWEVELGVVIGRRATYVSETDALDFVAGYCVCNDLSEREFQLERGGQWDKGKNCETFGPLGPWLVTPDEVPDPQKLRLWLDVNGRPYQRGCTATMIFGVRFLVHYVTQFMPLEPGDVISTGTPPGVGLGQRPPVYLRPGDQIRLGIEALGEQHQTVVASE